MRVKSSCKMYVGNTTSSGRCPVHLLRSSHCRLVALSPFMEGTNNASLHRTAFFAGEQHNMYNMMPFEYCYFVISMIFFIPKF